MRHIIAIILLAGCDWIGTGECLFAGEMFGPCIDHACADDLQCFTAKAGEMCVPSSAREGDEDVLACAAWRGGEGLTCVYESDFCYVSCDVAMPESCKGGTVCDSQTEACVYPPE